MRRLIINADDFALSAAVTAGILEAHAAGTVTSTSMMVHCAGWDDGVRQAKATSSLGVGLHFNLLVGAPLAPVPSLTDRATGRFPTLRALAARVCGGRVPLDEITAECEAQLTALRQAGVRVTHIDSHRHTHALPRIRRAVAAVAARHGLPLRRPLESPPWFPLHLAAHLRAASVRAAWALSSWHVASHRHADHFIGIALQGGARFGARLARVLDVLPLGTTELMVHPGRVDDALRAADPYTWQRERELDVLLSPAVRQRLRRDGLALIDFAAL